MRWLLFICCSGIHWANAQTLLADGSFEQFSINGCQEPDAAFDQLTHWYRLDASPDLFSNTCLFDENGSFFWNKQWKAADGERFIGLSSRWNSNATYVSEGIATQLTEPLDAGQVYQLRLAIRNRGGYQGFDEDVSLCNLYPEKHLAIYTSTDSILIDNNFANGTSSTTARLATTLSNDVLQSRVPSEKWTTVSACFRADGGERFLGISMPLGTFGALPPCAAQANSGVFRSFYFHLDEVVLEEVPSVWERELDYCESEELLVNVSEAFENTFLEDATFEWEDGWVGAERQLQQAGDYFIQAQTDCDSFEVILTVQEVACEPDIYVPTIFSPNGDGINDLFKLSFSRVENITDYRLQIFSRWGQLVFDSQSVQEDWDGKFRGIDVVEGMYAWQLRYGSLHLDKKIKYGSIQVVR